MATLYKDLTEEDKDCIKRRYESHKDGEAMFDIQTQLANHFDVTERTIRNWANKMELNVMQKNIVNPFKVMVYDIETSRVPAMVFWTGKTYINHGQLKEEPRIISVSWKWLGEDEVFSLKWDENHSDEKLVRDFLPHYNSANMLVGFNNDSFDNKWVNARAAKYGLDINLHLKSFDIMKQAKKLFRVPSFSMAYLSNFFGVTIKQSHEGIRMWDMIQDGTKEEQEEYLQKMVDYNVGDIVTTEELYLKLRKYMGHKTHLGLIQGKDKHTCPNCGGDNIEEYNGNLSVTPAGTIQRHMICRDDETQFKISNITYLKFKESL